MSLSDGSNIEGVTYEIAFLGYDYVNAISFMHTPEHVATVGAKTTTNPIKIDNAYIACFCFFSLYFVNVEENLDSIM